MKSADSDDENAERRSRSIKGIMMVGAIVMAVINEARGYLTR